MAFPDPALTVPTLTAYQFSYNGLTMGANTPYGVLKAEGLDLATIRSGDVPLPRDHGELRGLDVFSGRDVILDLWMKTDGTSLQSAQLALATATQIQPSTELPLWFPMPNYTAVAPLCIMCRPRKRPVPWDVEYSAAQIAKPMLTFHATDPRIYGPGQTVTESLTPAGTGLMFPIGPFPIIFGSSAPATTFTVTNAGNTETRPIAIFTGPITNPILVNTSLPGSPYILLNVSIAAGDQVLVDFGIPHRILYYVGGIVSGNAPSNAFPDLDSRSQWWDLVAGGNVLQFASGDPGPVAGTVTVQWASAFQW